VADPGADPGKPKRGFYRCRQYFPARIRLTCVLETPNASASTEPLTPLAVRMSATSIAVSLACPCRSPRARFGYGSSSAVFSTWCGPQSNWQLSISASRTPRCRSRPLAMANSFVAGSFVVEPKIVRRRAPGAGQGMHWSTRTMAAQTGLSQSSVSRIWRAFGLKPHIVETWKLSTDPDLRRSATSLASACRRRRTPWC
jgi:hypothetical protein